MFKQGYFITRNSFPTSSRQQQQQKHLDKKNTQIN